VERLSDSVGLDEVRKPFTWLGENLSMQGEADFPQAILRVVEQTYGIIHQDSSRCNLARLINDVDLHGSRTDQVATRT
jgi:hypothetical protein